MTMHQQGYPRFFYLDGAALKLEAPDRMPQRYAGRARWETFYDLERFATAALAIDSHSFDLLLRGLGAAGGADGAAGRRHTRA